MTELFLLLWIILPRGFFSASHSKLAPDIFPIFPPLAIVLGQYLARAWEGTIPAKALRANAIFVSALFAAAIAAYFIMPIPQDEDGKLAFASISFVTLLPIIVALAGLAYVIISKRSARVLICALAAFGMTAEITANYVAGPLDRATIKPLIPIISAHLQPEDLVVAYGTYFQDLPVYLNRNVIVVGYTGELQFGVTHYPETHAWMISAEEFWQPLRRRHAAGLCLHEKTAFALALHQRLLVAPHRRVWQDNAAGKGAPMNPMILILTGVMLNAAAQLLLKIGMRAIGHFELTSANIVPIGLQVDTSLPIIGGMICYAVSILVWLVVLSRVEVSFAYPLVSIGYVVTALAAYFWLGEALGPMRVAGIAIIIVGVFMVSRTA